MYEFELVVSVWREREQCLDIVHFVSTTKNMNKSIYIYIVRGFRNDFVLIVSEIESERDERRDEQNKKNTIYVLNRTSKRIFFPSLPSQRRWRE